MGKQGTHYTRYTNQQARKLRNTNDPTVAAEKIAEDLTNLRQEIHELHEQVERGERLYFYLQKYKPELLADLEEQAGNTITAFKPLHLQLEERTEELQTKMQQAKPVCRQFSTKRQFGSWLFGSRSGGNNKKFNIEKIREAGLGKLQIGGRPLIKYVESVDTQVWKEALQKGIIDLSEYDGLYTEEPRTRPATIKYIDPHQQGSKANNNNADGEDN